MEYSYVQFTQENIQELEKIMEDTKNWIPFNSDRSSPLEAQNRLTQEVWYVNDENEAELRLVFFGNLSLTISRVYFENRRQNCMTRVFHYLKNFCCINHIQKMVVSSVLTTEMEQWCRKMGFQPIPNACYDIDGVKVGDYELILSRSTQRENDVI